MSDVTSGAVMTLAIPLATLVVVLAVWALGRRWLRLENPVRTPPPEPPPES